MINIFKKQDRHTPEPERKYGLYAYSYYVTGGLVALLWIFFFTLEPINETTREIVQFVEQAASAANVSSELPPVFHNLGIILAIGLSGVIILGVCAQIFREALKGDIRGVLWLSFFIFLMWALDDKEAAPLVVQNAKQSIHVIEITEGQENAFRMAALFGAYILFTLSFLTGWKWSLFRKPAFIPQHVYIGGFIFLITYFYSFAGTSDSITPSLMAAAFAFLPPLAFFALPVYVLIIREVAKESQFYQQNILEGRGQETSRLAGFLTYFNRDITDWFRASKNKIIRTKESPIYLGRTTWLYDYKILQRDIGIISEQHLITIAGSGAGKSRDSIFNNILSYNGGMIAFDTKGEHVELAYHKRKAYAPAYVLDPYKKTAANIPRAYWNPLDEIDIRSNTARSDLDRIAAAIIPKEKGERAVDIHFRHIPQIIMRGYIAHILTTYPKEKQHLGTLYDLFIKGDPDGEGFDPLAVENVVKEMAKNDALGGAPSSAAAKMATMDDRERAAHYSTIFRSIDWLNDPLMREIITKPSTFSIRDCKLKDASVFLILPEKQLYAMSRFLTLFYTVAFDVLDEHETKQPEGSKRRVLFLFDEFEALGNFELARHAALRKRSSYIKCWFVVQNFDQFKANYSNLQDFMGNADKQFFGVDTSDSDLMELIKKALGTYSVDERGQSLEFKKVEKPVMSEGRLNKVLDGARDTQIFIPVNGLPMILKRVPFYKNFGRKFKKS